MWYIRLKTWPDHWWPDIYAKGGFGMWFYVDNTSIHRADKYEEEEDAYEELEGWVNSGEVLNDSYEVVYVEENNQ